MVFDDSRITVFPFFWPSRILHFTEGFQLRFFGLELNAKKLQVVLVLTTVQLFARDCVRHRVTSHVVLLQEEERCAPAAGHL